MWQILLINVNNPICVTKVHFKPRILWCIISKKKKTLQDHEEQV